MNTAIPTAPHRDALENPALFEGVRTRRILAIGIDFIFASMLVFVAAIVIFFLGIMTLGAGWLLYAILTPLVLICYVGWTMGGPAQATWGMQMMDIRVVQTNGKPIDWMVAIAHSVIFWGLNVFTSGFAPLLGLFTRRKQLAQDLLLDTLVVRTSISRSYIQE